MARTPQTERNPLHVKALTRKELRFGMRIQRFDNTHRPAGEEAIVASDPFQESHMSGPHWKVHVAVLDPSGRLVNQQWFLADCGIVPSDPHDSSSWNQQCYSLEVGARPWFKR